LTGVVVKSWSTMTLKMNSLIGGMDALESLDSSLVDASSSS
jgi:hypothetical protein